MLIGLNAAVTNQCLLIASMLSPLKAQNPQPHGVMLRPGLKASTRNIGSGTFASRSCVDVVHIQQFSNSCSLQSISFAQ